MADESSSNPPSSKPQSGEINNSMTDDEIGQLSNLISDCMESSQNGDDTGSFTRKSDDEDTGEFKPVQD